MARGARTPPMLEVRPMFEPTRLAAACLEAAYARMVPTPRRRTGGAAALPTVRDIPSADARVAMPRAREVRHG